MSDSASGHAPRLGEQTCWLDRPIGLALPRAGNSGCNYETVARSILIVDDDASFRDLAARVVTEWGYTVVGEAGDFEHALRQAASLEPQVALVDIGLPDGDGFALTRELRVLPCRPRVVLISSDSDRANILAARRAGACGFVPKDELSGARLRRLLSWGENS